MRHRSDWLVIAQFVLLALLLLPGEALWSAPWLTVSAGALGAIGLALSIAGVAALGRDIVPWVAPKDDAPLRTTGVFRLTRNPVYLGILVGSLGWVAWRGRIELLVVWALLPIVLITKAHVEQRFLLEAFGDDYRKYASRTPLMLWGRGIR
ncbi:methyltransferase family protein [Microbacterium sp. F2]|jgi:protein-S-isoprenylcysteine O-methyltransferase Ste14|uniref:methyltransferase family protein n=1 Tax=Microbacterium sp. F2 TaxID=3422228 RepID=UPI003FD1FE40